VIFSTEVATISQNDVVTGAVHVATNHLNDCKLFAYYGVPFSTNYVEYAINVRDFMDPRAKAANNAAVDQIKVGMTFGQIAEKVPLSEAQKLGVREHGGVWYKVPIDNNRILQLRFEHLRDNESTRDTRLNLPPQIRPANS
jgi:hypothetical protein